jgi:hypothetical protein
LRAVARAFIGLSRQDTPLHLGEVMTMHQELSLNYDHP